MNKDKKEKIDIDKTLLCIIRYLLNGLDPDDLEEYEKNIMHSFLGEDWKNKWLPYYQSLKF